MTLSTGDYVSPPSDRRYFAGGMEQFHHPRPVRTGRSHGCVPTPQRRELVAGLSGRILEIGAGDGVKLSCFPANVTEIVLVEPDPFLRAAAGRVAAGVTVPVEILEGDPRRLPVGDGSCDAVVCSLVLCCATSVRETLREVRRVLAPGGELRFYEHQRSSNPVVSLAESLLAPLWSRVAGGCDPARDTVAAIRRAGFEIEALDRFVFRHFAHALGTARPGQA
ncbi:class I SAM-dependent methyltransferase [Nonomuraea sp. NPDC050404]|uniref:class I SAM-dependent methyltransferase n=1 Tax=Nonomuraea sp. NPDC050404 TaxID=3155783 RepID=UPI00340D1BA1